MIKKVVGNVVLVMFGVGFALGLMELLFRANPQLVPPDVRVSPPVRRIEAFADQVYDVKISNGDLFYWMKGKLVPLTPEQDKVVAQVHYTTDGNGFRNDLPEKDTYPVVTLGDSFTIAPNVPAPWPQKLSECTGLDVLNLGGAGLGPQEELEILRKYGLDKRPQLVVMAYFEGNDLYDAGAYEQASPFIVARLGKYILTRDTEVLQKGSEDSVQTDTPGYLYPIAVTVDDSDMKMAFFSGYASWSTVREDLVKPSQNYRLAQEAILEARDLSEAAGAQFLLVYIPTKEHIYLPYLSDTETLGQVFSDVPTLALSKEGFLQFTPQTVPPDLAMPHLDDQVELLTDFAATQHIAFLNLTSYFQTEAATGTELYYPFDTHWNQQGHDLAAETISLYVDTLLAVPANATPCHKKP